MHCNFSRNLGWCCSYVSSAAFGCIKTIALLVRKCAIVLLAFSSCNCGFLRMINVKSALYAIIRRAYCTSIAECGNFDTGQTWLLPAMFLFPSFNTHASMRNLTTMLVFFAQVVLTASELTSAVRRLEVFGVAVRWRQRYTVVVFSKTSASPSPGDATDRTTVPTEATKWNANAQRNTTNAVVLWTTGFAALEQAVSEKRCFATELRSARTKRMKVNVPV